MFQLLSKHSFSLVRTYSDRVFLGFESPEGELHLYPYSLDGELGEELKFSKKEPIRWIYLRSGLWLIEYEEASKEDTHIYIRLKENGNRPSLICTQIYIS